MLGYSEAYTFEGTHDREDEAQNLIVAKRRTPENRGIMFKIEIPDTETAIGKATVSKLKVPLAAGMLRSSQRSLAVSLMTKHQKLQNPEESPSSVEVDKATITLKVGETSTITASVLPVGASQEVTFTSSNPPKAKVNASGVVEGVAEGTANITVASKGSPSINKVVQVTVEAAD